MMKRYLMVLTLLLALPALASAWTVNAKTSPLTGQGTIAPAGNKTYVNGEASGIYTVVAAAGKKIARVTIDGVTIGGATPDVTGSYTVPYAANKSTRYIVAYFANQTIDITLTNTPVSPMLPTSLVRRPATRATLPTPGRLRL